MKKFDGKLKGAYQFPITFPFPTHLDLPTFTTIFLPLQTPSDTNGRLPRSSPPSTPASPSASSSFPSTTSPRTSRFRSLSSPMTSFISPSMNTAFVYMSTNSLLAVKSAEYRPQISLWVVGDVRNLSARRNIRMKSILSRPQTPQGIQRGRG